MRTVRRWLKQVVYCTQGGQLVNTFYGIQILINIPTNARDISKVIVNDIANVVI